MPDSTSSAQPLIPQSDLSTTLKTSFRSDANFDQIMIYIFYPKFKNFNQVTRHCARVVNGLDLNSSIQSSNGFGLASSNLVNVAYFLHFFAPFSRLWLDVRRREVLQSGFPAWLPAIPTSSQPLLTAFPYQELVFWATFDADNDECIFIGCITLDHRPWVALESTAPRVVRAYACARCHATLRPGVQAHESIITVVVRRWRKSTLLGADSLGAFPVPLLCDLSTEISTPAVNIQTIIQG